MYGNTLKNISNLSIDIIKLSELVKYPFSDADKLTIEAIYSGLESIRKKVIIYIHKTAYSTQTKLKI